MNLIQDEIDQLEVEVRAANWATTDDEEIKKAVRQITGWRARKLAMYGSFSSFKAMTQSYFASQVDDPDSVFKKLEKLHEGFESTFEGAIAEMEEQDELRNLFTLEERPASLMDCTPLWG